MPVGRKSSHSIKMMNSAASNSSPVILYSYRRCPYAMRARMALKYAGIDVEFREIELRNKPQSMLQVSPKGTVPVLCVGDLVLDQSIAIMRWALKKSDPDGWGDADNAIAQVWIDTSDGPFKTLLDQYKYPNRFPELESESVLKDALELMLLPLEKSLQAHSYLLANNMTWVDVAIFPFIRQFSMVDPERFEQLPIPATKEWLAKYLQSELFKSVMHKYPVWVD